MARHDAVPDGRATFKTLEEIVSLAPRSEIVFTYHVPEDTLDARDRQVLRPKAEPPREDACRRTWQAGRDRS
jgi:hypothetical protein